MAANLPKNSLHKPHRETKNPGVLIIEGNKFYCGKIKPETEDSQDFHYYCSEKDGATRINVPLTLYCAISNFFYHF